MNCPRCELEMTPATASIRRGKSGFWRGLYDLWFVFDNYEDVGQRLMAPGANRVAHRCDACDLSVIEYSERPTGHWLGRLREMLPI